MSAIPDYTVLVVEAGHISGITDVAQRAGFYVGQAEKYLEKELSIQLPPLETYTSNNLLLENPELYLQSVLFQVYVGNDEEQKAVTARNYLTTLIDEHRTFEMNKRWTDGEITLPGKTP